MMIWDVMPHGGASQIHPHISGFVGTNKYLGKMGHLHHVLSMYQDMTKRDYLKDYLNFHIALGLGLRYRTASIIIPLDSQKDHEFVIVGTKNLRDWIQLLYIVYRTYVEELQVYCFSSGMAWPTSILFPDPQTLNRTEQKSFQNMPIKNGSLMYAKIGSRGNCQSVESDVSSLELYTINSLSTDPYVTFRALKKTLQKYS